MCMLWMPCVLVCMCLSAVLKIQYDVSVDRIFCPHTPPHWPIFLPLKVSSPWLWKHLKLPAQVQTRVAYQDGKRCPVLLRIKDLEIQQQGEGILESKSCSVVSDSSWGHGLYSTWNSPGQNTGVDSHSLFQRIFPIHRLNPGLPHCRQILHQLSYQESPSWSKDENLWAFEYLFFLKQHEGYSLVTLHRGLFIAIASLIVARGL